MVFVMLLDQQFQGKLIRYLHTCWSRNWCCFYKAFTCQAVVMLMLAVDVGFRLRKVDLVKYNTIVNELLDLPNKVENLLKESNIILDIANKYKDARNFLYLGRGYNFPIALEGALKLKEISYIHAEGYPAAEMKHGPIALIDEDMPVVVIATRKVITIKLLVMLWKLKQEGESYCCSN